MRQYTKIEYVVKDHRLKLLENKRNDPPITKLPDKPVEKRTNRTV